MFQNQMVQLLGFRYIKYIFFNKILLGAFLMFLMYFYCFHQFSIIHRQQGKGTVAKVTIPHTSIIGTKSQRFNSITIK